MPAARTVARQQGGLDDRSIAVLPGERFSSESTTRRSHPQPRRGVRVEHGAPEAESRARKPTGRQTPLGRSREPAVSAAAPVAAQARKGHRGTGRSWKERDALLEPTLDGPGCLSFRVYADPNHAARTVVVERWEDRRASRRTAPPRTHGAPRRSWSGAGPGP
ncbi:putative quinol monooxygenase [Streptomyces noursei]|uniref:putative quinol monooxygenase n=1 Tax=Streptomyces noursei TaxID=1971 RepID=UPI0036C86D83